MLFRPIPNAEPPNVDAGPEASVNREKEKRECFVQVEIRDPVAMSMGRRYGRQAAIRINRLAV